MTEKEILNLIQADKWMMRVLLTASSLNLKDWAVGAGFVRNKVWDYLSGKTRETVDTNDIDLVYFDPNGNNEEADKELSKEMLTRTGLDWEIVNQCYAHKWNNVPPYKSTKDAIAHWPETVTAIGVTIDKNNKLKLIAPYGIGDLVHFIVRLSPKFEGGSGVLQERVRKKQWLEKWPGLKIVNEGARPEGPAPSINSV
ncbi:MAG: nucleotidyltransferase family protein [Candidatus Colwellbacteria bacterium]|nr:nucleotidyltransferase family protein [Candidatus Colwellbacteria bacterium]